ncbi:hypothetical protein [Gordonia hydrophobica]|uniref:N-acetyltransferase domain-containing protein n=1 Tax=Gordonia hydrophobica TaxID=40516 RepID=A0ABZ2U6E8_9ACTN|nr:hypothetical protein [Gordonia hydrophobica]MBM7365436.1 WD40 repeat protein [Gordonia hydrophobica]
MVDVVTLDETRLPEAIAVMEQGIADIPLYRWLLGEYVEEKDKREWLAELFLKPLLRVGYALGGERDGRLVCVLTWQPHDVSVSPDGRPPLTPEDVELAVRSPGLRERLLELWTAPPLPTPIDDAVNCLFITATPEARGVRTMIEMMRTVEDFCREHHRPVYLWTGSPRLRDWFLTGWHGSQFATREWNGMTMYGLVSERPLTARAGQRV